MKNPYNCKKSAKEFVKAPPNAIKEYERLHSDSNFLIDNGSDSSQKLITLITSDEFVSM